MRRGVFVGAWLVAICTSPAVGHDPIRFDTHHTVPGALLRIVEVSRSEVPPAVRYRLQAVGLPRGVVMAVWTNEFGHGYHQFASGLRVDESGNVSTTHDGSGGRQKLDEMLLETGRLPRGAGFEVALVGEDRKVVAYARVVPYPIVGRQGPCEVSLELASRRGERFLVSGTGFLPDEQVLTQVTSTGKTIEKTQRTSSDGRLPLDSIVRNVGVRPSVTTDADPAFSYRVRGRSCEVVIEHQWGEPSQ
jgi:hypothetical protein